MIKMKRLPITLIALVALFGIVNCVAIEPALAQMDGCNSSDVAKEGGAHCDFICCSSHHLWNVGSTSMDVGQSLPSLGSVIHSLSESPDPPLGSIFRPPLLLA